MFDVSVLFLLYKSEIRTCFLYFIGFGLQIWHFVKVFSIKRFYLAHCFPKRELCNRAMIWQKHSLWADGNKIDRYKIAGFLFGVFLSFHGLNHGQTQRNACIFFLSFFPFFGLTIGESLLLSSKIKSKEILQWKWLKQHSVWRRCEEKKQKKKNE